MMLAHLLIKESKCISVLLLLAVQGPLAQNVLEKAIDWCTPGCILGHLIFDHFSKKFSIRRYALLVIYRVFL